LSGAPFSKAARTLVESSGFVSVFESTFTYTVSVLQIAPARRCGIR
jgi:hypothetical protein